ncbi:MAG: electron transport complex subunit RsxE [Phycisphaerales bacterium]|nr:electron transport complex subunit RsxE [Phycisphaerales bacterium]
MPATTTHFQQFRSGLLDNNPVLVQLLGMCPVLAVTSSVENGLVMGGAATFVVVMSNLITSLLRKLIQPHVRILVFTLTIATFVTIADLVLKAFVYDVAMKLGAFIPLIIVNCMIIARAEVVAMKNGVARSLADAFGIGLGFTGALLILGAVRELLGAGTLLNFAVLPASFEPHKWIIMILPPGAFLTLGVIVGVVNWLRQRGRGGA